MRRLRISAVTVVLVLCGGVTAVANGKTLILRVGAGEAEVQPKEKGVLNYNIAPVGSEPAGKCRASDVIEYGNNRAAKDAFTLVAEGRECDPGFRYDAGRLNTFELAGTGKWTAKAKPKLVMHMPKTFEFCEPGGKCKIVSFECAYSLSKVQGTFHIPGEIVNLVADGTGKRLAKESDARCPTTQAFEVTAFTAVADRGHVGSHTWAEL